MTLPPTHVLSVICSYPAVHEVSGYRLSGLTKPWELEDGGFWLLTPKGSKLPTLKSEPTLGFQSQRLTILGLET